VGRIKRSPAYSSWAFSLPSAAMHIPRVGGGETLKERGRGKKSAIFGGAKGKLSEKVVGNGVAKKEEKGWWLQDEGKSGNKSFSQMTSLEMA